LPAPRRLTAPTAGQTRGPEPAPSARGRRLGSVATAHTVAATAGPLSTSSATGSSPRFPEVEKALATRSFSDDDFLMRPRNRASSSNDDRQVLSTTLRISNVLINLGIVGGGQVRGERRAWAQYPPTQYQDQPTRSGGLPFGVAPLPAHLLQTYTENVWGVARCPPAVRLVAATRVKKPAFMSG